MNLLEKFRTQIKRQPVKIEVPRRLLPSTKVFHVEPGLYVSNLGGGKGKYPNECITYEELRVRGIKSGDRIYLQRGEIVNFTELPIHNLNNILIDAFGTGADPILRGSTYNAGTQTFIDNGDGTWYIPYSGAIKWVAEDDTLLRLAESDWIAITSVPSSQVRRISAATLAGFSTIVGAKLIAKEFSFRGSEVLTVTASNTGTGDITFSGTLVGAAAGMPLKIYNQKQFMTVAGDWFYDSSAQRLYIKSTTTPTGRNIRIITEDTCFRITNSSTITIDGIEIKHYCNHPLLIVKSGNVTVENSHIHASRGSGIRAYGNETTNLTLNNLELNNLGLRGVEHGGIQTFFYYYLNAYDIGLQLNIGYPFDASRTGGTAISPMAEPDAIKVPNFGTIEHCTLNNLGYQGMQLFGDGHQIRKNVIHDYCKEWSDGGAIHLFYANSLAASTKNVFIENNIIYNGITTGNLDGITSGAVDHVIGIYLDNGVNIITVNNNVVYNPGHFGIFGNAYTTEHILTNNIVTGGTEAQIQIRQDSAGNASFPFDLCQNCVMTGNILASPSVASRCFSLWNINNLSTFNPFSSIDTNHYVAPYGTPVNERTQNNSTYTDMTLAQWQTYIGGDGSATARTNYKVTPDADDILIEVNATDSAVTFNTPVGYSDYEGNAFSNPVSIPAWYGLIYFQN